MSRPLTVTIPHTLGRAAARKRVEDGIAQLRNSYAGQFTSLEENWNSDRFDCRLSVFKQTISGSVDIGDDAVTVSILLPIFLSMLADKVTTLIQQRGQGLLEHKG
ncbi:polyhydroxyalkanoic acid system family protein [Labrys sp. La1]|uniref:polyhydroxyalkanoic acid system family protein n=1 Tax=Labrys sp. La1 TaxID=3404917 RepID=UPI003EB78C0A